MKAQAQPRPAPPQNSEPLSAEDLEIVKSLELLESLDLLESLGSDDLLPPPEGEEREAR